ncbi:zinc-dependent peptidase [Marivirga arenosa]|uniref:Zinc-dependent peptidase n=1 Tax=Marivirga arenosa TaxID=3059076 RepID=A0AA49GEN5_9BACT|nr:MULTISPECIES: zinc-dependent peptidase [unclassified Marivirga]WKK82690.2 zinc-dependent peptidase [Marivirga sp. BKB1-2]WKK86608.2 zinc-dependent peptidase [Marivirga sp. ABR2-2]
MRLTLNYFGLYSFSRLNQDQVRKLKKYSPYFRKLKHKHQREFMWRVSQFIAAKSFVPRGMKEVTEEMKVVVAALSVQITFGLPRIYLSHFKRILIYPDSYYSTINNQYHKGEVNPRFGIIVLSWKNLVSGIANETDGINLGIHELAHAIHLENRIHNTEFGFIDQALWDEYSNLAQYEMMKINTGEPTFFREVGGVDHYEFFAVLLENFFERPKALKNYSPKLYHKTCLLLRQDPLKLLMNI